MSKDLKEERESCGLGESLRISEHPGKRAPKQIAGAKFCGGSSPGRNGKKTTVAWWDEGGEGTGDKVTDVRGAEMMYSSGSQLGVNFTPGDIWQCLETFLVYDFGWGCYLHLVNKSQGCY